MDPLSFWAIAILASIASTVDTNDTLCPSKIEADKIRGMSPKGKEEYTYRLIEYSAEKLANHPESGPEIVAFLLGVAFALDPLGRMVRPELAVTVYKVATRRDEFVGGGPYTLSRVVERPGSVEIRVNGYPVSHGYQSDKIENDQRIYALHNGFVLKKRDGLDSEGDYVDRVTSALGRVKDTDRVSISHDCAFYDANFDEKRLEEAIEKELRGEDFEIQASSRLTSFVTRDLKDIPGNSYRLLDFVSGMKTSKPEEMSAARKEGLEWNSLSKFLSFKIHANAIDRGSVLNDLRIRRESLLSPDLYEEEYGGKELLDQNSEKYGLLRGSQNPANWLIEAFRRESGSLTPSSEMLLTYWDSNDPGVISECARIVAEMAKSSGMKVSDYKESLRNGMKSWYKPNPSIASGPARGSVSFSS